MVAEANLHQPKTFLATLRAGPVGVRVPGRARASRAGISNQDDIRTACATRPYFLIISFITPASSPPVMNPDRAPRKSRSAVRKTTRGKAYFTPAYVTSGS